MPTEEQFVGLEKPHVMAGKKHLLYAEMEILTSLKKYNSYKKFRKEELALKNLLKKVITELKKEMEVLMQYVPVVRVKETMMQAPTAPGKRDSLEQEIQNIRKKISMLGA
jgi:vancomycin resistance protein YoaR